MNLLFLDIDGVLNIHGPLDPNCMCGQIDKDKVRILNDILVEADAKIVLSSAWRYIVHRGEMNLRGMEWLFRSHGILADRLIGITREDSIRRAFYNGKEGTWPITNERGQQIADWRRENNHSDRYVVIDDLDLGIRDFEHPFVHVNGSVGLTRLDALLALKLFQI